MANTRKDTSEKVEKVVDKIEQVADVKVEPTQDEGFIPAKVQRKVKKQMDRDILVEVMNVTNGTFVYVNPKTGAAWDLVGFGATDLMDIGTLLTIKASSPRMLDFPSIVINDEEAVDFLGFEEMYKKVLRPEDIDLFFSKSAQIMGEFAKKAPRGVKNLIASKARELIESGQLDSKSKIKALEEALGIELEE